TLRAGVGTALEVLRANAAGAPLDASRIAAFGYCFGGTTVLELARDGADVAGVVTFHGGLGTSLPAKASAVKASVLVLNGADDRGTAGDRSEEHTSELQSRENLVCRLLLEKKDRA